MKTKITTLLIVGLIVCVARLASAADAAENWNKMCASCHGKDGTGNTMMGRKLAVKDLTDAKVQAALTDEQATKAITDGVTEDGKDKMKSFKDKLTADEIKALVAYIRTFKK